MSERRRWDIDERFVGVADATSSAPDIERLLVQTTEAGWITEDAEAHLGWHLRDAASTLGLTVSRLEVIDDDEVSPIPRGDGAVIFQPIMTRRVDRRHLDGRDRRDPMSHGLAHGMVEVSFAHEVARKLVVGCERTVRGILRCD